MNTDKLIKSAEKHIAAVRANDAQLRREITQLMQAQRVTENVARRIVLSRHGLLPKAVML